MALRATGRRYGWEGELGGDVGVIGLRGGYHGDTVRSLQAIPENADIQIGSMDASEASTYNKAVDWYKGRGYWFAPPIVQFVNSKPTVMTTGPDLWPNLPSSYSSQAKATPDGDGWSLSFSSLQSIYDVKDRLSSELAEYYRYHIRSHLLRLVREGGRKFGGLVIEPVCLGAGGMVFVDPLFQACLVEVVRASGDLFGGKKWDGGSYETELKNLPARDAKEWRGLPVVYDEGESILQLLKLMISLFRSQSLWLPFSLLHTRPHSRCFRLRQNLDWRSFAPIRYSRLTIHLQCLPVRQEDRRPPPRPQLYCQPHRMLSRSESHRHYRETPCHRRLGDRAGNVGRPGSGRRRQMVILGSKVRYYPQWSTGRRRRNGDGHRLGYRIGRH